MDPAWIAGLCTAGGGVLVLLTEHWLSKRKRGIDEYVLHRDELRDEIKRLREEVEKLEDEVDKWRADYYDLRDQYIQVKTELQIALEGIKREAAKAEKAADQLIDNSKGDE